MNGEIAPVYAVDAQNAETNAVAGVLAEPSVDVAARTGCSGFQWAGAAAIAAVVAAGILLGRASRKNTKAFAVETKAELVDDILDAIAKGGKDRPALRAELSAALDGTGKLRSEPLSSVLRIEESYEKKESGKYLRRISILQKKADRPAGTLSKVESEVSWEYVPDSIRAKFIETRQSTFRGPSCSSS